MVGRTLSHYRVVEPLGAGGMGEVFRAHDEKLDRDVALKVLPAGALGDEEARKRFRKEANALSRLSHPHIATIHDFDTADGVDFLVMELVRGPSLRDEIEEKGALPEKTVVRLGSQLARGLQAAHEQGIVHRDLKPGNLQLTPDGLLKILDFGLARLLPKEPEPGEETAPTQTAVGRVAGTLPYMSPEQLRGRGVDARADLYAAGAVLYEMATGRRLFSKASSAELTEAILSEEPTPPRQVNATISPGLELVILKALDKDPELRHQTAKDLLVDLERLQLRSDSRSSGSGPVVSGPTPRPAGRARRRWTVGVAALIAVLAGGSWLLRPPPLPRITDVRPLRLDLGWLSEGGLVTTWTTDGLRLYYVARREQEYRLFQTPVAGGESSEIEIPELMHGGLEIYGFLPRQSALLCLTASGSSGAGWPVWSVPVPNGTPRRLGGLVANTAAVSSDGTQIALMQTGPGRLLIVGDDGSTVRSIDDLPLQPSWPTWAPDGRRLRFSASSPPGQEAGPWIWETTTAGDAPRPLWPGRRGVWTRDGRFFVLERSNALAQRFDLLVAREPTWNPWSRADPAPLTSGPSSFIQVGLRPDGRGLFAFGVDRRAELLRFDRRLKRFEPFLGGQSIGYVDPSPDGQWLAWVTYPDAVLWQGRRDGGESVPLTLPPLRAWMPRWSPDGKRIVFIGQAPGEGRSVRMVAAGGGEVEVVARPDRGKGLWDPCWVPDGSIVFGALGLDASPLWKLDLESRAISPMPDTSGYHYPKCGRQGQILALKAGDSRGNVVWSPERGAWEEIGPAVGGYASWTRDGRSFCTLGSFSIRCYSLAERRYEPLADVAAVRPLAWIDGAAWMGLDLDDSPLLTRDAATADLYALDWEIP